MPKKKPLTVSLNPTGVDGTTRRFTRNLAILAREMVPPELLIEFHLAVLQEHNPKIVPDDRTSSGWRVTWNEKGETVPTLVEKTASVNFLRQAGWGMPSQAHYIEADVRSHAGDTGVDLSSLAHEPKKVHQLLSALRLALSAGTQRDPSETPQEAADSVLEGDPIDAEWADKVEEE